METGLNLAEKIYLFSIHPEKGGIISDAYQQRDYVLAGAVIFSLLEDDKIALEEKKIRMKNNTGLNPLQEVAIQKMSRFSHPVSVSRWVNRLSWSGRNFRSIIKNSLKDKRLIGIEHKQFLFFKWDKVFLTGRIKVTQMIAEVENQINNARKEPEEIHLQSLLNSSGLLKRMFPDREKRKNIKAKLKQSEKDNVVAKAVADAIRVSKSAAVNSSQF
jgi:hypothetical protein